MTMAISAARLVRFAWKRCIAAAVLHGLARFFMLLGVLLLTAWSYTVWGNPASPLAVLFWPGLLLLAVAPLLGYATGRLLEPRCDALEEIRAAREGDDDS